jgi:hypothetical protein
MKRGVNRHRWKALRKSSRFLVAAIPLILAGLVLLAIAFTQITQNTSILNNTVQLSAKTPYLSYGVSANYYLKGNTNGTMKGSLQSSQCCVDFYLFTDTLYANWVSNNFTITNSSNSPILIEDSSKIDSPDGIVFSFVPDPSSIYHMVFLIANRSLWNGNSTAAYYVVAKISSTYSAAEDSFLIYPAVVFLAIGAILVILRNRYSRS